MKAMYLQEAFFDILLQKELISKDTITIYLLMQCLLKQQQLINVTKRCNFKSSYPNKDDLKKFTEEQLVVECIKRLDAFLDYLEFTDKMVLDVANAFSDIAYQKTFSKPIYLAACTYIQRFVTKYKHKHYISNMLPKLVFLPLSHSCLAIRNVAERTLDIFSMSFAENETISKCLLEVVQDTYCEELLLLFTDKQEAYVLKVWKHIVNVLGKTLHGNYFVMKRLFQLINSGFRSLNDEVCARSFCYWKIVITSFASDKNVLDNSDCIQFLLKPLKTFTENLSQFNEPMLKSCSSVFITWWFLAWHLSRNRSSHFTEVCISLLEFTIGKISTGQIEEALPNSRQMVLKKAGCRIILELLNLFPDAAFFENVLSSIHISLLEAENQFEIADRSKESSDDVISLQNLVHEVYPKSRLLTCLVQEELPQKNEVQNKKAQKPDNCKKRFSEGIKTKSERKSKVQEELLQKKKPQKKKGKKKTSSPSIPCVPHIKRLKKSQPFNFGNSVGGIFSERSEENFEIESKEYTCSGGEGSSRKCINSDGIRKTPKRKSTPCANETKKIKSNTLKSITETVPSVSGVEMNMVDLKSNSNSEDFEDCNKMDLGGDEVEKIEDNLILVPSSKTEGKKPTENTKSDIEETPCVSTEISGDSIKTNTEINLSNHTITELSNNSKGTSEATEVDIGNISTEPVKQVKSGEAGLHKHSQSFKDGTEEENSTKAPTDTLTRQERMFDLHSLEYVDGDSVSLECFVGELIMLKEHLSRFTVHPTRLHRMQEDMPF